MNTAHANEIYFGYKEKYISHYVTFIKLPYVIIITHYQFIYLFLC